MVRLILASASPRRLALLREAGYDFDVDPADVDESALSGESPEDYVLRVAALKARAVAARRPGSTVVAGDTTVVVDGEMIGKPAGDDEARAMLRRLSGRAHEVLSGVVVIGPGGEARTVVASRVRFRALTPADVDWYVATGEPFDKAGGYGVQGLASRFVESVEGSYSNVVGLPIRAVAALLGTAGILPGPDGPGNRPASASGV